jgi:hypothetical protein
MKFTDGMDGQWYAGYRESGRAPRGEVTDSAG